MNTYTTVQGDTWDMIAYRTMGSCDYVDQLMNAWAGNEPTDDTVSSYFDEQALQMEDIVKTAVQAVSALTHLTAVAVLPGQPAMRIATSNEE